MGDKVGIVCISIDVLIVTPFNNKTTLLDERLTIGEREGLDAGNGGIRNGNFGPSVTRDTSTGGQREKEIIALGVAGGHERNRTKRARARSIGRIAVLEDLDIRAQLQTHACIVGSGKTSDNG
jgi:hypothetical protein